MSEVTYCKTRVAVSVITRVANHSSIKEDQLSVRQITPEPARNLRISAVDACSMEIIDVVFEDETNALKDQRRMLEIFRGYAVFSTGPAAFSRAFSFARTGRVEAHQVSAIPTTTAPALAS